LKKDYDLALETFLLQFFTSIALKIVLFVLVITQLGVQTTSQWPFLPLRVSTGLALQGSLPPYGVLILLFKPFKVGGFTQGIDGLYGKFFYYENEHRTKLQ
jgi:small conductance mechanosensitive channel